MFLTVNLQQDKSKLSNYLSNTLLDKIDETLNKGEKVLLYLNKRGSYSSLICEDCQHLFECPNCDTSLSVHSNPEHLRCHICNNAYNIPKACSKCHKTNLKAIGIGTQQIESILKTHYTDSTIYRFDSDAMKNISSKREALGELDKADIIIGTKMITTGFDFENIGLIGILLVEGELSYPSYDAEEKAYCNLRQLIGRGNRKSQETQILLQTFIPKNPLLQRLTNSNFKDFFSETLVERKDFLYPPYREMVTLEYRHKDSKKTLSFTEKLEEKLKSFDNKNSYQILRGGSTFKKNNSHHATLIVKGNDVRVLLKNIENIILRESGLSVIFH
ncbi:primosomal protein N' [Candidatus Gracilibacteria bacterium]|nr:primosomal protein N' [Candidatus Gracilibacteria bacterium]